MRPVIVTGGAGFIGSHLVEALVEDHDVTAFDDLSIGSRSAVPTRAALVEGDVRRHAQVDDHVAKADIVFHEAALVSVPVSIERPLESHAINATGTLRVLEAARSRDVRVVLASSAAIYGHPEDRSIEESHPMRPTSPYGVDKLTADLYTRIYHELYGVETLSLRYFNVYGPRQTGGAYAGVIATFIEQALCDDPITVHGAGEQTRDFVYVDDVVRANLLAAETERVGEAFNIGTSTGTSIRELAERIQDLTDTRSDIVHVAGRVGDIEHSVADISKAREHLGFEPEVSLEEGLTTTIRWYADRHERM